MPRSNFRLDAIDLIEVTHSANELYWWHFIGYPAHLVKGTLPKSTELACV